ncbi:ribonuclease P protein component [Patescibacteria group bacterium]|nr:ribonuclease P protein component [Patescibacteria group bacterium]
MIPKTNRLLKEKNFKRVAKNGKYFFGRTLVLKVIKSPLTVTRLAIIVSAKVSKKAVERNKIKRRLREVIRLNLPNLKKGFDVMILVKPLAKEKNSAELSQILEELFKKANLC